MLRVALFLTAAVLLAPATASAAPFGELPFSAAGAAATCLRATGAPGELVRSSRTGARFLQVGAGAIAESDLVMTGSPQGECPQVAARPNGAGVIAQAGSGLWVATRDSGAAWTKPAKLAPEASRAAVAVADSGTAVVAWIEPGAGARFTVKAMRRSAGGAFGPAETLGTASSPTEYVLAGSVRAAIAADGEALVLWTQPPPDRDTGRMPVNVAIAPAGGAFGAPQRIGLTYAASVPALAAGPDGRALVALATLSEVQVAERAPGGAFGAPAKLASVKEPLVVLPTVAMGSGGAAVVGWYGLFSQGVSAVSRAGTGAFGTPMELAAATGIPGLSEQLLALLSVFGAAGGTPTGAEGVAPDVDGGNLRAVLTPNGGALLSWNTILGVPRMAAFPLSGGHLDRSAVGTAVRETSSVTPLLTASGTPAIAWTDNAEGTSPGGRVHVAVEGLVPAPDAPAPRVTLGRPRKSVLKSDDALELPVTCSAACEVRVDLPGGFGETAYVELPGAGTRVASIESVFTPIAPARRGPVRVRVRYSAPGARSASERVETVTLELTEVGAPPKVIGLKAVRHGSRVDVSWRTNRKTAADAFIVVGSPDRGFDPDNLVVAEAHPEGQRRFTARLKGAKDADFVIVFVGSGDSIGGPYVAKVR